MEETQEVQPISKKGMVWPVVLVVILILGIGGYFLAGFLRDDKDKSNTESVLTGEKISIPQKVMDNKFGWLGGGEEDTGEGIVEKQAGWARPHPGAFVWDMSQQSKSSEIDFTLADKEISNYQKNDLGILATIWPFADWDQKNLADAESCKVLANDEFLPSNDKKGRGSYLPQYRCNPSDWEAYQKYVGAAVERYDGDGQNDMPGLKMPIKYWEVMNEPDLQYQNNLPQGEEDRSLNFYKQGPVEYAQLLIKTSQAIRLADSEAKVLIAGAAGADSRMLNFYRQVFAVSGTKTAFDIGNIHCISNDRETQDFNVGPYKSMLAEFSLDQPIWVTEAEAMSGTSADVNYESTKISTTNAITAGAQRIFFTRDDFGDTRTDMSKLNTGSDYPSTEKYREIIQSFSN